MRYAKYDQKVIYLISKSRNPGLFPELKIPRSTANYWIRSKNYLKIKVENKDRSTAYEIQRAKNKKLQEEMSKLNNEFKILKSYILILKKNQLIKPPSDSITRFQIVQIVKRFRGKNSIRSILDSLHISLPTYKRWAKEDPLNSFETKYLQRTCRSLTHSEVLNLQTIFSNKSLFYYPLHALSIKAKKEGQVFASPRTWRKYIRMLKLRRPVVLEKNQTW